LYYHPRQACSRQNKQIAAQLALPLKNTGLETLKSACDLSLTTSNNKIDWHFRALQQVNGLKHEFRGKAREVGKAVATPTAAQKKGKLSYKTVFQKRELVATGKELKAAKRKFEDHIETQAKRQCRSLCERMSDKLPRELRNMVYQSIIMENNATFYDGPGETVKFANGCSTNQHCFDAEFTGSTMHKDLVEELSYRNVRFDFRHRHALISAAFDQYASIHDLANAINNVGLTFNLRDLKGRDIVLDHLKGVFEFRKGAHVHVFIEADGRTQAQIRRSFRRVLRSIFMFLGRLKQSGYEVTVVMTPSYIRSNVKNSSDSRFSIIHEQDFRYSFELKNHVYSTSGIELALQKVFYPKLELESLTNCCSFSMSMVRHGHSGRIVACSTSER
jgi:hypothetical protein